MSGVFEHSIKVPRLYKTVAKIVQTVREDGASLKQLVYLKKHPNIKALYALALTSLQHGSQLDQLIRRTKILVDEPRLDPWLARVLITELLWGKKHLSSECKPVKTVLSYEKSLKEELKNVGAFDLPENKLKVEKPRYVRVNTLSMAVDEAVQYFEEEGWRPLYRSKNYVEFIEAVSNLSGMAFIQDIHVPELLIFPPKTQFYNHAAYTSGSIILQDKASCLPAYLLNAKPGSTVLDMCAAPGMKTTHLAAILKNRGKIYAVEVDIRRYQTLCEIVASTNSDCVETINADVMTLNAEKCPDVEYVLVDPSCSGSGMLDRLDVEFSSNEKCAPGRLRNLQSFQIIILRHALLNFPMAKRIVYSTCSIYPEENEQVVDDVLSQVGNSYRLVSARSLMNNNWLNYSSTEFNCKDNCLYARPETDLSNGFFVAVFERNFDVPLPQIKKHKKNKDTEIDGENQNVEQDNCAELDGKQNKKKKKKKKLMNGENGEGESAIRGGEKNVTDDSEDIAKENYSENCENNSSEIIPTKKKKSKRKHENYVEVEPVENNDQKSLDNVDEEILPKKKKKKCKKSRSEDREVDSDSIREENVSSVHKKKKCKKSKKNNDNAEIEVELVKKKSQDKDSNVGVEETIDQEVGEKIRKKRKEKKV